MREKSEMTLREAAQYALEALEEIEWSNNSQWQSYRAKVSISALRDALAEEQNYVNRWISVEENLPKEGQLVLGLYYKSNITIVYRKAREIIDARWVIEDEWVEPSSGHYLIPPTHWMPLPEYEHVHKMESNPTINKVETVAPADKSMQRLTDVQQEMEQQPVAWRYQNSLTDTEYLVWNKGTGGRNWTPLYTHPPRREPEQEPVAWMVYTQDGKSVCVTDNPADFTDEHRALPLFTHPPRREWVGLTEEERLSLIAYEPHPLMNRTAIVHAVEAKLKEKNHE